MIYQIDSSPFDSSQLGVSCEQRVDRRVEGGGTGLFVSYPQYDTGWGRDDI
jgi:hypothetical protein